MNSHAGVATRTVHRVFSDVHEVWHDDLLVLKSASSQRARDDALRRLTKSHTVFGQALAMQQVNISKIGGAGSSSYVERLKDVEKRRQERVQAGGKRKTRYEGLIDWSNSADMPDITEQPTPCRAKQAKRSSAKDRMLDSTAQDYVQNMMDLEQTEPFWTAEECVRMLAKVPARERNCVALAWSDNGVIPMQSRGILKKLAHFEKGDTKKAFRPWGRGAGPDRIVPADEFEK